MDDLGIWKAQQKVNSAHTDYLEQLGTQVRFLTIGLIATTIGLAILTLGIILK